MRAVVRGAMEEFLKQEHTKAEPAYKAELVEERRRREQLEQRVNELVQENQRSRQVAEEAERSSAIRAELQRLGVAKVDLAYRVVRDVEPDALALARGAQVEKPGWAARFREKMRALGKKG